jgi:GLPGLI family protein
LIVIKIITVIKSYFVPINITIMKKHVLLFTCLLVSVFSVKAQKADTAGTMVHYKFSHLRDTTKPAYNENMMLLLGKNSTAYKSYDRRLADLDMKKQVQEQMAANGGSGQIRITRRNGGSGTEYYLFPDEKKLVRKERLINSYIIEEPMPVIDWQVSSDIATFGGLHCQKATAHFKGRDYTAWFCPDIPVHSGPWKLSGLPGLILEAYDAKKEVVFKFDGIEDMSKMAKPAAAGGVQSPPGGPVIKLIGTDDTDQDPRLIEEPSDGIKTTEKEFTKLRDAMRKDPDAFAKSAMAGSGANMSPNGPQANIHIQIAPNTENNPIELPEKK